MELPWSKQFATPGIVINPLVPEVTAEVSWTCPRPNPLLTSYTVPHTCRVPLLQVPFPQVQLSEHIQFLGWGPEWGLGYGYAVKQIPVAVLFPTSMPLWLSLYLCKSSLKMSSPLFKCSSSILCTKEICLLPIQLFLSLLLNVCAFFCALSRIVMQRKCSEGIQYFPITLVTKFPSKLNSYSF